MIIDAACAIESKKQQANELNVFPVPDGDTGTNMALTMSNAMAELSKFDNQPLNKAAETTASALLRGARGNSGVILSLLFRGVAKSLKDQASADALAFSRALTEGVETAYKAVMKPAEGTILTVSRVSAEKAVEAAQNGADISAMFREMIDTAHEALQKTTEQNPVLKKAGVVDAGAFGYITILEGMQHAYSGEDAREVTFQKPVMTAGEPKGADFADFKTEDIKFAYCTEFIASRDDKKRSPEKLRHLLNSIGDSVVLVDDDEIIKVHVHTNQPDRVLSEALRYGALKSVKIENMREQHTEKIISGEKESAPFIPPEHKIAEPERKYGFVAVAAGEGLNAVFKDLGVDQVVSGGQTMNPSTEDILLAVDRTPSEIVYVLPNNKNIIMAAEQAVPLSPKQVIVLQAKTVPQGISALLAYDSSKEPEKNREAMEEAIKKVRTGLITYAARDSVFGESRIKEGDFIALLDGKLIYHSKRFYDTAKKLSGGLIKKGTSFVTVIKGCEAADDQTETVKSVFEKTAKNAEITVIDGGQPVYYFIISAE
ncbi:MAG: DAK2 domain-containing protein [Bacillota bacterium]|nr:DAK2 domain-containing protein [Bacillota bacterium]